MGGTLLIIFDSLLEQKTKGGRYLNGEKCFVLVDWFWMFLQTPLHRAAYWGEKCNVEILLQYGADGTLKDVRSQIERHCHRF